MPVKDADLFSVLGIPDSDGGVRRATDQSLAGIVVHQGPDSLLVALEGLEGLELGGIPHFDGLVVGCSGELFLSFWVNRNRIH